MLRLEDTVLIIVDVQDKLANVMHEKEVLFENIKKIIKGAQALKIPILWTEQNPDRLGKTIPEIARLLPEIEPMAKLSFSCADNRHFMQALKTLERKQVLIAGIETHICVYQTAVHLVHLGYEAHVVVDAVSSRSPKNVQIGLGLIKSGGAVLTSTETALFELLKVAEGPKFREILKIVK